MSTPAFNMDAFQHAREQISRLQDQHAQWAEVVRAINGTELEQDAKDALWQTAWYRHSEPQRARISRSRRPVA